MENTSYVTIVLYCGWSLDVVVTGMALIWCQKPYTSCLWVV